MNAYSENAGRHVALLLIAGSGVVTIAKGMSLTFLAIRLQRDFGLGPAGIGALIGAGPLLGAIVSPFAGTLSDRIGRKGVLTAALLMAGLALARHADVEQARVNAKLAASKVKPRVA